MAMRKIPATLTTLFMLAAYNAALAQDQDYVAHVDKANGTVMIDHGRGYFTTDAGAQLKEGDRVITLDRSGAEIVFKGGCRATLKANNLMTINANPGCKAAIIAVNGGAATATAAGAAVADPVSTGAIVGGVLLVGGIAAAASSSGGGSTISAQ